MNMHSKTARGGKIAQNDNNEEIVALGGEVDIRVEYQRKKDRYSDLCNIISCDYVSVL